MSENNPNRPGMQHDPNLSNEPLRPDEVINPEKIHDQVANPSPDEISPKRVNEYSETHPHESNAPHDPAFNTDGEDDKKIDVEEDRINDEKVIIDEEVKRDENVVIERRTEEKPIYTKWWFWLIIIAIIAIVYYLNTRQ